MKTRKESSLSGVLPARHEARAGAVLAGLGFVYLLYRFGRDYATPAIDLEFIWLAGRLLLDGVSPYGAAYAERARDIFANQHAPEFFSYPFNWAPLAMMLATLKASAAALVWRLASIAGLLAGVLITARALRPVARPAPTQAVLFALAYLCLMQATPIILTFGQTSIVILAGVALTLFGTARAAPWWQGLGLIVVMLKPQIGLPIVAALAPFPRALPAIAGAGAVSLLFTIPALLAGGFVATIADYAANIARHNAIAVNSPASMTGLRNLAELATGLPVPVVVMVGLATVTALGISRALKVRYLGDPATPARAVIAALAVTLAVVPLHTYDFVLVAPLLLLALTRDHPARWLLLAGLILIFRSDNVARWTGFYAANAGYFPGSLLNTLAAILLLAATLWLVISRADDSVLPERTEN